MRKRWISNTMTADEAAQFQAIGKGSHVSPGR
jgi:OFA family oxalate/formate antiporter-like MFS transporter